MVTRAKTKRRFSTKRFRLGEIVNLPLTMKSANVCGEAFPRISKIDNNKELYNYIGTHRNEVVR